MLVADGSIDIAVEVGGLAVWDLAAVKVVVEEAGGRCTDLRGERAHRHRRRDLDERAAARRRRGRVRARLNTTGRVRVGTEVTVGIDIGTSSVKAIAADGDGNVVARAACPARRASCPAPERFEHDAAVAWRDGPRRALAELGDLDVRGV